MSTLKAYGDAVVSIFQLIGDKENDITKCIAWAMLDTLLTSDTISEARDISKAR